MIIATIFFLSVHLNVCVFLTNCKFTFAYNSFLRLILFLNSSNISNERTLRGRHRAVVSGISLTRTEFSFDLART